MKTPVIPETDSDAEVVIMISATTKISANSPPKTTINHLMSGARGQTVEWLQGVPDDIRDIFALSKARDKPWGPKMFMFAPGPNVNGKAPMTREFFLTVAWPACAAMFDIPPSEGIICEHIPQRPEDHEHTHYHVCVNHYDPLTGRARSWSWDRAKLERYSRTMEVLIGSKILVGRFQPLVIRILREMNANEMADAIEKANPPDAEPKSRTPTRQVEQAAKAKKIDLRSLDASVRAAYVAASDLPSFRSGLAEIGLTLQASYRIPHRPAWVLHKDGEFVRALGGCLPRVKMTTIITKLGAPEHDGQTDIIDAIAAASPDGGGDSAELPGGHPRNDEVSRAGAGMEGTAGGASGGALDEERAGLASLFVDVLCGVDHDAVREMQRDTATVMASPLLRAMDFFRNVIDGAKAWLDRTFPKVSPFLARSREIVKETSEKQAEIEKEEAEQKKKLERMVLGPHPTEVGRVAHQARLEQEQSRLADIKRRLKDQGEDLINVQKVNEQFERAHQHKYEKVMEEHGPKAGSADRRIRSAVRCQALLRAHPELAPMGAPAIFVRALREEHKARKNPEAKFKVEQPDSYVPTPPGGGPK
ncbi:MULTISPECIES: hypothetical protein [unclassified Bradyrhizobium]|uniref:hypothetical protein n=1 Tax=unclassified Bradyrhizobium TaxID=2631580 RepID=UPI003396F55F